MRPSGGIIVRCLRCRHEGTVSDQELAQFGFKPTAPIAAFVKRLRCSKCGSGSVMAKRLIQPNLIEKQKQSLLPRFGCGFYEFSRGYCPGCLAVSGKA